MGAIGFGVESKKIKLVLTHEDAAGDGKNSRAYPRGGGSVRVRVRPRLLVPIVPLVPTVILVLYYNTTHRPHSSSFLGLPYRILNMKPKKELLWGLWVSTGGTVLIGLDPQYPTFKLLGFL